MNLAKQKAWRCREYLDWVKQQPCCLCGAPSDDAHHLVGRGHMGGMGTKAPDIMAFSVCRGCHQKIHTDPSMWDQQWEHICRTVMRAVADGVLVEHV